MLVPEIMLRSLSFLLLGFSLLACGDGDDLGSTKKSSKKGDASAGTEPLAEGQTDTTAVQTGALPTETPATGSDAGIPPSSTPPTTSDAGSIGARDAGAVDAAFGGRVPCFDLAYCCAMPKPCDAETIACTKVVQAQDQQKCADAMHGYVTVKCSHGWETSASFLPDFNGCSYDYGGGP